jgi:hypothetical protein
MAYSTDFDELLQDGVSTNSLASVSTDGYGTPVMATGSTYKGRFVRKQQLVRTFAGTEELSQAQLWVASTTTFAPSIEFVVNGSTVGPLMSLEAYPDEDGVHHSKAFFG